MIDNARIDEALDAVFTVTAAVESAEATDLFAAEVEAAADMLRSFVEFGANAEVRLRLGWLYWLRYQSLPEDEGSAELADSLASFLPVYGRLTGRLPAAICPLLDPDQRLDFATASSIGVTILRRAQQHADLGLLDGALHFLELAGRAEDAHLEEKLVVMGNSMAAHVIRYERTGSVAALDSAVELGRRAVSMAQASPNRPTMYGNLAASLLARAQETADQADLDASIEAARGALTSAAELGLGDLATYETNMANALRLRYEWTSHHQDLDEALALGRRATKRIAADPDHDDPSGHWLSLANTLRARYDASEEAGDLDEAMTMQRRLLTLLPNSHPSRPVVLGNLGNALRDSYLHTGDMTVLDDAILVHRQAIELSPNHPRAAMFHTNLAYDLSARYDARGDLADLSAAADLAALALNGTDVSDPKYPARLSNLGSYLWTWSTLDGSRDRLDRAVALLNEAVTRGETTGDPDLPALRSNLAAMLMSLFETTGQAADLDRAISAARLAADHVGQTPQQQRLHLSTLGNALLTIYEVTADTAYLNEAVTVLRQAARTVATGHPRRAVFLSNLSNALRAQYERLGDDDAGSEADRLLDEAITITADSGPERASYLSNRATLAHTRYARELAEWNGSDVGHLDQAIRLGRATTDLLAEGHPDRPRVLSNLSISLRTRYELMGERTDLDDAITAARLSTRTAPVDHPDRSVYLGSLGGALETRYSAGGEDEALAEACDVYRESAHSPSTRPVVRLMAARLWGRTATLTNQTTSAMAGFELAFDLLGQVSPRRLTRGDQQHQLAQIGGLASEAAACALDAGDQDRAIRWLEQGRGVLIAQQLDHRTDLHELHVSDPELAAEYESTCQALDRHPIAGAGPTPPTVIARRRQMLAERWQSIVNEIRRKPNFDQFLQPPSTVDLQAEAVDGPIIMINVGERRSDALILTKDGIHVRPLDRSYSPPMAGDTARQPLPGLTINTATEQARQFLVAVGSGADKDLRAVLSWLWDVIAEPVFDVIGSTRPGGRLPRIWWLPTGPLSILPLHAASAFSGSAPIPGASALDRAVSSYTPTIRALRHARRGTRTEQRTSLVVAMPSTPGATDRELVDLPAVSREATLAHTNLGGTLLTGAEASRHRVLAALATADWAHFACHASSDNADPSRSYLMLHDGVLTAADIGALNLPDASVAYLSACSTADGGARLVDEAIHISSAFQLAGFSHTIAALWPVGDSTAMRFAREVYRFLGDQPGHLAEAVHHATRTLRARYPASPRAWAAHLHTGP